MLSDKNNIKEKKTNIFVFLVVLMIIKKLNLINKLNENLN